MRLWPNLQGRINFIEIVDVMARDGLQVEDVKRLILVAVVQIILFRFSKGKNVPN